ncbi:hypothetical protein HYDPIDRAFT_119672 [Hydnomerulius pinastri MD-312]|uniref:Uncharacterized protein n=1 Tax=Hydnomerulius pinastri MD-312 TaxID=994086 RepID=A0A0C9VY65_9AGAM|nr:hypothetical protein HYDPIDRAFT_119672 [Hydnomerulius pinastri MD-312]
MVASKSTQHTSNFSLVTSSQLLLETTHCLFSVILRFIGKNVRQCWYQDPQISTTSNSPGLPKNSCTAKDSSHSGS